MLATPVPTTNIEPNLIYASVTPHYSEIFLCEESVAAKKQSSVSWEFVEPQLLFCSPGSS